MPRPHAVLDGGGSRIETVLVPDLLQQISRSRIAGGQDSDSESRIQADRFRTISLAETLSRFIPNANSCMNVNSPGTGSLLLVFPLSKPCSDRFGADEYWRSTPVTTVLCEPNAKQWVYSGKSMSIKRPVFIRRTRPLSRPFAEIHRISYVGTMKSDDLITVDPEILGGTAVFKGTRVPVKTLFDYLEDDYTLEEFLTCFPTVTREMARRVLERSETALLSQS